MGKTKKYFVIYKGKKREIVRQEFTKGGSNVYTIPVPSIQKELGGSDLHFSNEEDGKIQHIKSRKYNYEKTGSLCDISSEVFREISEKSSFEEIPKGTKGVMVTPFRIQELVNRHTSVFNRLPWEYFNLDNFNGDLAKEEAVELDNLAKVPRDKIAFFFTDEYVYYYFNNEFKKIKTEHFCLLKRFDN